MIAKTGLVLVSLAITTGEPTVVQNTASDLESDLPRDATKITALVGAGR